MHGLHNLSGKEQTNLCRVLRKLHFYTPKIVYNQLSISKIISHLGKSLKFRSEALRPRFGNGCVIQTPRNVHALCNATHHWRKTRRISEKLRRFPEMLTKYFWIEARKGHSDRNMLLFSRQTTRVKISTISSSEYFRRLVTSLAHALIVLWHRSDTR